MAWSQAYVAGTSPAARSRHSTVAIGSKLYVFGGGDDSRVYNDLYVLDTETMAWSRPVIKGTAPVARWGHTGTYVGDSKIVIFGGHDGQRMLDDIAIFDTATMAWIPVAPPAKNAEGQPNTGPTARAGHTATLIPGKRLLIFGGGDGSKIYSDSWFFELNGYYWVKPTIGGTPPAGRCAHTANMIDDQLVIFGGGDGGRRFKDMYIVDIGNKYALGVMVNSIVEAVFRAEETKKNKGKKPAVKAAAPAQPKKKPEEKKGEISQWEHNSLYIDITTWLTSIGMKKYAEKFVAQEIDMETVQFLSESHLEQLGITTIGARLRFMAAIKTLSEAEPKEAELVELASTLKESMDALASSTNRLTEVLKGQQLLPVLPVAREKQQNGSVKQTAAVPVTDEGGFSDE